MSLTPEQIAEIQLVKNGMRITKVVATRAVKTKRGDFFVGMSSAWDSIQDDAAGCGDLVTTMDDKEQQEAFAGHGLDSRRARIAGALLGRLVDLQACAHALAGGAMSHSDYLAQCKGIDSNYNRLLSDILKTQGVENG